MRFGTVISFTLKKKDNWYDRYKDSVVELNPKLKKIITKSSKFINASIPNRWAIIQSLEYVKKNKIKGDVVETGVFHGGGLILINDILFTDYFETTEQKKLIDNEKDFFNNWKQYSKEHNESNVNILNAS